MPQLIRAVRSAGKTALLAIILLPLSAIGQVKLPKLVGDGMVLQRNDEVKIWGWASADEPVTVHFRGTEYSTTADEGGRWQVDLPSFEAGGPYEMTISGGNTITIEDILIGDVWVASGQSNMELWMGRVSPVYGEEIANSENDYIRQFEVPDRYDFDAPKKKLESGSWQKANPETILSFSAVAYFFAKELYDEYGIPIGIINASLGGSPAEAWISEKTLKSEFPKHYREAVRFRNSSLIDSIQQADQQRIGDWYRRSLQKDEGYSDPENPWYKPGLNTSDWKMMEIPGYWADAELGPVNGVVWFRKEFRVPESMAGKEADLNLGRIVDADSVFVNGTFVGSTSYQYPPRWYTIPSGVLKEGKNIIAVRIINSSGKGGFVLDKPYELSADGQTIDLKGQWKYKLGTEMEPLGAQTFIRWKPMGLYNAMIAPLLDYSIKGVIWYQGESNEDRPVEYEELFPALIRDWRNNWNQGNFPFLFVQLANFREAPSAPSESNWARLRESQLKTLSLPNTGMAVTIDIGEWNDIHPLNKKDVGKRLVLAAKKVAYGENDVVYSGPIFKSMEVDGSKAILSFDHVGSGLTAKNGEELRQFAIAGADSNFVWADARIEGNEVVVWSDEIDHPTAVRYAWADNPEGANLYNKEGLPASPFRTDDWETQY